MSRRPVSLLPLDTLPRIGPDSDLCAEIVAALGRAGIQLAAGDIVVVAQKVISKAEGRSIRLEDIEPTERARELARITAKDPRLVQAVLDESRNILRSRTNVLVVEHRLGHVMANAGIDRSNMEADVEDEGLALLLPEDPDRSARELHGGLEAASDVPIGVIVSDSFGRAWRLGTTGVAIGVSGPPALIDRRGDRDLYGRALQITEVGFADAVAAAAVLVMGEGNEGCPVVIVRGLDWEEAGQTARDVLRPAEEDMFR